jgi:2-isopropylmalate synthase
LVGRKRWLEAGKHSGIHGVAAMLAEYGIKPTQEQLRQIVAKVKELGDKGKHVTDADLVAIASQVMNQQSIVEHVRLMDFVVTTGINVVPTASVRLMIDGKEYIIAETGVGPVDAALKAIQRITDKIASIRLSEFRLEAISGGSDALAEVSIKVEDNKGRIASARATGEDIVVTSVQAMINGINKIMMKKAIDMDKDREVKGYTV